MQSLSGYDQYFAMARGVPGIEALDMSKFFDTNYHYLVPELTSNVSPKPDFGILFDKIKRGQATIGKDKAVPIIIGEPAWLMQSPGLPLRSCPWCCVLRSPLSLLWRSSMPPYCAAPFSTQVMLQ